MARFLSNSSTRPLKSAPFVSRATLPAASCKAPPSRMARAKISWRARESSSPRSISSSTRKPAGAFASKGKRCSSRSQKAWMVWIFKPPGVSTARAKSFLAKSRVVASSLGPAAFATAASSVASSSQRPVGENGVNARRHIRRRRLGVGKAENARGRHALKQQPHDALRQHISLAGPRMRRDPGGNSRIGCARLRALRRGRDGAAAHASSPPSRDHSLTRAR